MLVYVAVRYNNADVVSRDPFVGYGYNYGPGHGEYSGRTSRILPGFGTYLMVTAGCLAAINVLGKNWAAGGYREVVIATDDKYLLLTLDKFEQLKSWGWKSGPGPEEPVHSHKTELIQLDEKLRMQRAYGVQTTFWKIETKDNLARKLARGVAFLDLPEE